MDEPSVCVLADWAQDILGPTEGSIETFSLNPILDKSDCDYYILVIGGRYGSITPEGISYTEKEFDYAVSKDMKVVALLHGKPEEIPIGKSELDPSLRRRLEVFRNKVSAGRLVRFWNRAEELPGLVALSLAKTIKTYPAVGWVRANAVANEDLLSQLNQLRQDNDALKIALAEARSEPILNLNELAGLDEQFTVHISSRDTEWLAEITWGEMFSYIAPYIEMYPDEDFVKRRLVSRILERKGKTNAAGPHAIDEQDFMTISIQLKALGLVVIKLSAYTTGKKFRKWALTRQGEQLMTQLLIVRRTT